MFWGSTFTGSSFLRYIPFGEGKKVKIYPAPGTGTVNLHRISRRDFSLDIVC